MLEGKVAIITGSAEGIGEGIARFFAEQGARVLLLDKSAPKNDAVAQSLRDAGHQADSFIADVRQSTCVDKAFETAMKRYGQIDVLINNAGIYPRHSFIEISEEEWDEVQNVNVKGMFYATKKILPQMLKQQRGKIVNISSVTFHLGSKDLAHYVASKGAVVGFTRSLAREVGPKGVHVNGISPGAVLVDAEKSVAGEAEINEILTLQSLKRRLLPIDIARVAAFLSCEWSDAMSGQIVNVDGGWFMG